MCWRASLLYPPRLKAPVTSSLMKRGEQNKRSAMCNDMQASRSRGQLVQLLLIYLCTTPALILPCDALLLFYCCCTTATCLYKCFCPAVLLLYSYFTFVYMHVYILLLYSCFTNACLVCVYICVLYSCFTPALPIIYIRYII
jgi:hypothetical protein